MLARESPPPRPLLFLVRARHPVIATFFTKKLVALFARVGHGAEGRFSSCYDPEEHFKTLAATTTTALRLSTASSSPAGFLS